MSARRPSLNTSNRPMLLAIGLTWVVAAVLVGTGTWRLREHVRSQIINRDGEILMALARAQQRDADPNDPLIHSPGAVMVAIGSLDGLIAATLYDVDGESWISMPPTVRPTRVPREAMAKLARLEPATRFEPAFPLDNLFENTNGVANPPEYPILRVYVPLTAQGSTHLDAIAGFVFEGSEIAREFARFDKRLGMQASLALLLAFAATGIAVGWAFRRLAKTNRLLAHRTRDLLRANQELSQSARVAALGAITAHLMHSLRSPISGLQSFMEARRDNEPPGEDAWAEALAATRRMQCLIQEIVRVLGDHQSDLDFEVPLREVGEAVVNRAKPSATARGVRLVVEGDPPEFIDHRAASLLSLLLSNLIDNGVQATDPGGTVCLRMRQDQFTICEVVDEGPGIPAAVRARLFQPQQSTKEGGSGLGLAISRQLALALGGSIELVSSDSKGSVFRVQLPHKTLTPPAPASSTSTIAEMA